MREWLWTIPGYRKELKKRISAEQKRRRNLDQRLLYHEFDGDTSIVTGKVNRGGHPYAEDIDKLGREVEGCG